MGREDGVVISKKDFKKCEKVPNPFKKDQKAFSKVVEVELVVRRFENLVFIVMNYAPSSIEILEPTELKVPVGEAQSTLNAISELIHRFTSASAGLITIDA